MKYVFCAKKSAHSTICGVRRTLADCVAACDTYYCMQRPALLVGLLQVICHDDEAAVVAELVDEGALVRLDCESYPGIRGGWGRLESAAIEQPWYYPFTKLSLQEIQCECSGLECKSVNPEVDRRFLRIYIETLKRLLDERTVVKRSRESCHDWVGASSQVRPPSRERYVLVSSGSNLRFQEGVRAMTLLRILHEL